MQSHPGQAFETVAQAQRKESAEESLPTKSHPLHGNTAGSGDAEWLLFNLLSLGYSDFVS